MDKRRIYATCTAVIAGTGLIFAGYYLISKNQKPEGQVSEKTENSGETKLVVTDSKTKKDIRQLADGSKNGQELLPRGTPGERPQVKGAETSTNYNHDGLTFEQAMKLYGLFGYRYQFVNCRGTPGNFIIKQGVKYMLDNRDPVTHEFQISAEKFVIPGYDFVINKAGDVGTRYITCDGGGASTVTVVP